MEDLGNWVVFMKNTAPLCGMCRIGHPRCHLLWVSFLPQDPGLLSCSAQVSN